VTFNKITAVLFAEEIEPCIQFWMEMGFVKTVEVPEGDKLGFAILKRDSVELMYQSYASAAQDVPALAQQVRRGPTFQYVEVGNLDDVIGALGDAEVVIPVRTTFYGAREIGIKDPAGHFFTFAQLHGSA
jgi:uncharacterized glyoxalase superfamily protein PhnB